MFTCYLFHYNVYLFVNTYFIFIKFGVIRGRVAGLANRSLHMKLVCIDGVAGLRLGVEGSVVLLSAGRSSGGTQLGYGMNQICHSVPEPIPRAPSW